MAMGVYPYITATIIMQLLIPIIPRLQEISKDGDAGRQKINQITTYLTIPLAILQGYGQAAIMTSGAFGGASVLPEFGFNNNALLTVTVLISLVAGSFLALWLGNLITEEGIGNGVSLIIFGGIVGGLWGNLNVLLASTRGVLLVIVFTLITIATVFLIVYVQEGQRRIPVRYGKRVRTMRGNRLMMVGGQSSHVPIRVNSAGMIPLIFASSLLIFPSTIGSLFVGSSVGWLASIGNFFVNSLSVGSTLYWILYFILVVAFTFFYTDVSSASKICPRHCSGRAATSPASVLAAPPRTISTGYWCGSRSSAPSSWLRRHPALLVGLIIREPGLGNSTCSLPAPAS